MAGDAAVWSESSGWEPSTVYDKYILWMAINLSSFRDRRRKNLQLEVTTPTDKVVSGTRASD